MNVENYINNAVLLYIMEAGSRGYYMKGDEDTVQNTVNVVVVREVEKYEMLIFMHFSNYYSGPICESSESSLYVYEDKRYSVQHLMEISSNYPSGKILSVTLR